MVALEGVEGDIGGRHVRVVVKTDHKGLVGEVHNTDKRRTKTRMALHDRRRLFNHTLEYAPRGEQSIPDAISKSPAFVKVEPTEGAGDSVANPAPASTLATATPQSGRSAPLGPRRRWSSR